MLTWTPELQRVWRGDLERTACGTFHDPAPPTPTPTPTMGARHVPLDTSLPPRMAYLLRFDGPLAHDEFCARCMARLLSWGHAVEAAAASWQIHPFRVLSWLRLRPDTRKYASLNGEKS